MNPRWYYFSAFLISCLLTYISFSGLLPNEFLFIHDAYLSFSLEESKKSILAYDLSSLGAPVITVVIVTFFDRLLQLILYSLGLTTHLSQIVIFIFQFFISIILPFEGFKRLYRFFHDKNGAEYLIFLIAIWYAINPFTLIYWHGNAFSLTLLLCYALAPLSLYLITRSLVTKSSITQNLLTAITIFIMSFSLYFFAVFIIFALMFIICYITLKQGIDVKQLIKNLIVLSIIYIPFLLIPLVVLYEIYLNPADTINRTGGETYGFLQGGILYPILMWFSWGIYTLWEPRNIFTFHNYFKTLPYLASPFLLYFIIINGFHREKNRAYYAIFLTIFIIFLFFIKGAQPPLGGIYLYLINEFPIFRIFRSPDNKFGFGIILSISALLILAIQNINHKLIATILIVVISIQAFPFYTGIAIRGENTETSTERIISIPNEYRELAEYANSNSRHYGYIVPIPSVNFGFFKYREKDIHIGQDMLPKLINSPFIYVDEHGWLPESLYAQLKIAIDNGDFQSLNNLPVEYILLRKDIPNTGLTHLEIDNIDESLNLVFENRLFELYEINNPVSIVEAKNAEVIILSPVEYQINFNNALTQKEITLYNNFNNNWLLYPNTINRYELCENKRYFDSTNTTICQSDSLNNLFSVINGIRYLFKEPIYQNTINDSDLSKNIWLTDSHNTQKFSLYYKNQAIFNIVILISFGYAFLLSVFLLLIKLRQKTN